MTLPSEPGEAPDADEIVEVGFPDSFKARLSEFILNGAQRTFFLEDGVRPAVARAWRTFLTDPANTKEGWGYVSTPQGYHGVDGLRLRFWMQVGIDGHRRVTFNDVEPSLPPGDAEDVT